MGARWVTVRRRGDSEVLLPRVRWCASFLCKLRGLSWRAGLPPGEGLLLVERSESRLGTAIHMLFMFFSIGVVWLDARGRVVDTCLAKPWRVSYAPRGPARYILETSPAILETVTPGDELEWIQIE